MEEECIVHFKLIRGSEKKQLRGLVFVPEGQGPTMEQLTACFAAIGYNVSLEDRDDLIFKPISPTETYKLDVTRLEFAHDRDDETDYELRNIASQFINPNKTSL